MIFPTPRSGKFIVNQQDIELERRISDLQSQLDRLSSGHELPSDQREHVAQIEERLSLLTQQFADILDRWTLTDLRHTRALGEMEARLNEWGRLETRFEQDAYERIRELERKIEQEWLGLRQMFEQPVQQLQEHAASLRETSVAAAGSALTGLERAETRLATIQSDLSDRMNQLSHDFQSVVAELRATSSARPGLPPGGNVQSWPLEQVMRLHEELRDNSAPVPPRKTIDLLPEAAASLVDRIDAVEHAVTSGTEIAKETFEQAARQRRFVWRTVLAVLTIGLITTGVFAVRLQRQMDAATAKVAAAEQEAEVARAVASRQIAATQSDAERRIAEARDTALRAQIVSEVLAASDLIRFTLTGSDSAPAARGQALWSRSRGIVFSASRLPAPPQASTYQLWLVTTGAPVAAGLVKPDSEGRASIATEDVPAIPRPVVGVSLTIEPQGGRPLPSGAIVLSRQQPEIPSAQIR